MAKISINLAEGTIEVDAEPAHLEAACEHAAELIDKLRPRLNSSSLEAAEVDLDPGPGSSSLQEDPVTDPSSAKPASKKTHKRRYQVKELDAC